MKGNASSWNAIGIINITPDSFSDGGKAISEAGFVASLDYLKLNDIHYFDIGAESTAPFNKPITQEEEWYRFEKFFIPYLNYFNNKDVLSFDTYRPSIIEKLCLHFSKNKITNRIIWNDISGKYDESVTNLLLKFSNLKYVFSHNLSPERSISSSHMDHILETNGADEFMKKISDYFEQTEQRVRKDGLLDRVIFDPCFGFSKSLEQNLILIDQLNSLVNRFHNQEWMIGISRKSFLTQLSLDLHNSDKNLCRELAHFKILDKWQGQFGRLNCLIRLHNPNIFNMLTRCKSLFELS
ncbi:MAG: dihydropteroate synthase [Bacteriovoracaceae bacterium]|jgi:dihydropteroate synthase|nr:dihydropteroate synthase [Bacteriovoracaceae bacterium]